MEVEDGFVFAEGHLIKKRGIQPELGLNKFAMAQTHGNDERAPLDQVLGDCSGNMTRWVDTFEAQPIEDHGMNLLGLGFDASRFNLIGG